MKQLVSVSIFIILFSFQNRVYSQNDTLNVQNKDTVIIKDVKEVETVSLIKKKKPGRAALFSAVLPGAGQVYNGKYWKVPLVYSALGSAVFFFEYNNKLYKKYLAGYKERIEHEADPTVPETIFSEDISTDVLLQYKNDSRRNRDLSIVIFSAVYILNIIDAVVDAELSDFDVSDDLSLKIAPEIIPLYGKQKQNTIGLSFCFNFK